MVENTSKNLKNYVQYCKQNEFESNIFSKLGFLMFVQILRK